MFLLSRVGVLLAAIIGIGVAVALLLDAVEAVFNIHLPQGSTWVGGFLAGFLCGFLPYDRWLRIGRNKNGS